MDGQKAAQGREELKRIVTDDLDAPGARPFRPDLDNNRPLVAQGHDLAQLLGNVGGVERLEIGCRERRQMGPHPGFGVTADQFGLEPGQVGHRWGPGEERTMANGPPPIGSRQPIRGSGKLTAYGESGPPWERFPSTPIGPGYQRGPNRLNTMRLGLIADIHADPRALDGALRGLEVHGVDQILCAGDLVGYGGQPDAVVALLRDRAIPCIRGNHDRWALERGQVIGPQGWKRAVLKDETWEYLHALPASARREYAGRVLAITTARPKVIPSLSRPTSRSPSPSSSSGTTTLPMCSCWDIPHIAMIDRGPRGMIVNPGSVLGVPGVQTSYSFAILDLNDLSVRIVDIRTGREIHRDPVFLDDEGPQGIRDPETGDAERPGRRAREDPGDGLGVAVGLRGRSAGS